LGDTLQKIFLTDPQELGLLLMHDLFRTEMEHMLAASLFFFSNFCLLDAQFGFSHDFLELLSSNAVFTPG